MTTSLPQGEHTIARMCTLAGISRAGYYRSWAASAPREEDTAVRDMVQRVALAEKHYGYRRIAIDLGRAGFAVNHKRVLRLMREDNLLCLRRRAFVPATTDSNHGWQVVPNLTHGIILTGLDQLWVADITYIRMQEEFSYLAIVLDAFSRRVVGWALETHLQASLAIAALKMAVAARRPSPGSLIHHSDRGVQGGFNRSSQHFSKRRRCDEEIQAFGSVFASSFAIARPASRGTARELQTVLDGDCLGALERGCCG